LYKNYEELKKELILKDFQKVLNKFAQKYKKKKVLIYGAGILTKVIMDNYDLSGLNIIAVADSRFKIEEKFYNFKAVSPDLIQENNPDLIIISTYNYSTIKAFLDKNYPKIIKIPKFPVIKKSLKEVILNLVDQLIFIPLQIY